MKDYSLATGFAYVEVSKVSDTTKEGYPLKSQKGKKMISVSLLATDSSGKVGYVTDYLIEEAFWKIKNIENAFKVEGLFTKGEFNANILLFKSSGAILMEEEYKNKNGVLVKNSKVRTYVPLSFYEMIAANDRKNGELLSMAMSATNAATEPQPEATFDDLPF